MADEHRIILSSTADMDNIFSENRGGAFVNKLQNEIILNQILAMSWL